MIASLIMMRLLNAMDCFRAMCAVNIFGVGIEINTLI